MADQSHVHIEIKGGVFVCVPNGVNLLTPYVLLEQEDWFEDEIKFVRHMLKPGMKVVDIGASYGVYALTAARCVGATGRVWAFEPSSATAACLARGIERNRFDAMQLIQAGLSNRSGQAKLMIAPNTELGFVAEEGAAEGAHEIVFLKTLDDCMNERGWKDIDFMKIDAEGHEEKILAGGARFFNSNSPLILYEIKAVDKINLGLADAFAALGYRSYRLIPGLNVLAPLDKGEPLDPDQLNLFCCKPDRADTLSRQGVLIKDSLSKKSHKPSSADWLGYLQGFSYAQGLVDAWRQYGRSQGAQPEWQVYESVLNSYARAHNPALTMADRYGCLQHAHAALTELLKSHATLTRLMSFVRVAGELGKCAEAVQALHYLIGTPFPLLSSWLSEPFLALADDLESPDPERNFSEWLKAAILARYEKLHTFSSYFSDLASLESSLERLETIRRSPLRCPEMERRRQLIRLRVGMQRSQQPDALLTSKTVGNLNPDFWAFAKSI
jgi:FkbM family methyltransferase